MRLNCLTLIPLRSREEKWSSHRGVHSFKCCYPLCSPVAGRFLPHLSFPPTPPQRLAGMHLQLQINYGLIFVLERESAGLAWAIPAWARQSSCLVFQRPARWPGCAGDFPPTPLPGEAPPASPPHRRVSRAFSGAPRFGEKRGREASRHYWNTHYMLGTGPLCPSYTGSHFLLPKILEARISLSILREHR